MGPLQKATGDLVTWDKDNAEVLNDFLLQTSPARVLTTLPLILNFYAKLPSTEAPLALCINGQRLRYILSQLYSSISIFIMKLFHSVNGFFIH